MSAEKTKEHLHITVQSILHKLLDQAEQADRKTAVHVRLDRNHYPDYWDEYNVVPRITTNNTLRDLATQGLVQLRWQKYEEGNWLQSVDLVRECTGAVYRLLGRTPHSELESTLRLLLSAQQPVLGWHANFLTWLENQLANHRSLAPLDLTTSEHTRDLLRALSAIVELEEPILERILSIRLFGNSKKLEALRPDILTVLRRHDPETKLYGDDVKAILQSRYVDTVPEHVILAGPLTLQTLRGVHDISSFYPSIALSAATIRAATNISTTADAVITVENATSFSELAGICPASALLIFTGGFASPAILFLLKKIHTIHPNTPLLHWGDLDVGGLRILAHLRSHLRSFTSLAMDVATFKEHQQYGQTLTPDERRSLEKLRTHLLLQDCVSLIDMLIASQQKLEQEAIRPSWFLEQLQCSP